jgi:hypothetical protein
MQKKLFLLGKKGAAAQTPNQLSSGTLASSKAWKTKIAQTNPQGGSLNRTCTPTKKKTEQV